MAMRYEPYGNSRARMEWDQRFICRRGPSKPALTSSTCMPKYMTRPTITQIRTSDLDKAKGGRATVSSTLAEPLTLDVDGLSDYVGTLKLLSAATERMFSLLADQITNVKHALPVEKGRENVRPSFFVFACVTQTEFSSRCSARGRGHIRHPLPNPWSPFGRKSGNERRSMLKRTRIECCRSSRVTSLKG